MGSADSYMAKKITGYLLPLRNNILRLLAVTHTQPWKPSESPTSVVSASGMIGNGADTTALEDEPLFEIT